MPLWGAQFPPTDLRPSDSYLLLDGTETIITGSKSIAFARGGAADSGSDNGSTFTVTGCPNGSAIDIQACSTVANTNTATATSAAAMDALFQNVPLSTINGNGFYTDIGRSMFYRVIVTNFANGDVPVVTVTR